ncbi:hypothetical protein E5161_07460 [Cohnella pontilimi]|uniref:Uncharacterized protein n=1 Tax=Cohnella pontilimi TaxID=2564100 RepID=A0A4V5LSD5_9BACL|nr:hypothetical protein [Cohnella pontilimi]TJY42679.1 hypothetical protein E5161_07460 [Cohnella pontilimi]
MWKELNDKLKIFKNRVTTVRKELLVILIVCFVAIILFDSVLFRIPEWFTTAAIWGEMLYKLCFAYITGFVFYFLNIHLEKERAKVKLYVYIHNKIADIVRLNHDLMDTIVQASQKTVENYNPSLEEIKQYCLSVNPHQRCAIPRLPFEFNNYFLMIDFVHKDLKRIIDDLISIQANISIDVLELLAKIEDTVDNHVNLFQGVPTANRDLEVIHNGIHQLNGYTNDLYKTFHKKYKSHRWEYEQSYRGAEHQV